MKNLVFYLPLYYPDKENFFRILELLDQEEAGYLELGIPVFDPFMDGAVIKDIQKEILTRNITPEDVVETLEEIKRRFRFKVVLMTYKEGVEHFRLKEIPKELYHGFLCVDGDYPPETFPNQISVLSKSCDDHSLSTALEHNQLFAYVVSGEGKTGSFESLPTEYIEVVKRVTSSKDIKEVMRNGADGAIIGTEFIKRYQMGGMDALAAYMEELKEAV